MKNVITVISVCSSYLLVKVFQWQQNRISKAVRTILCFRECLTSVYRIIRIPNSTAIVYRTDKKPVSIEGHKYYIEYRLNAGASEPGELKIRKNVQDALKKIGGKVVFDDNFNKPHHSGSKGW